MRIFKFRFTVTHSHKTVWQTAHWFTHTHTHTHTFSWIIIIFVYIYIYYNLHVSTHIKFHDIKVSTTVTLKRTAVSPNVIEEVQDLKSRQERLHSLFLFRKLLLSLSAHGSQDIQAYPPPSLCTVSKPTTGFLNSRHPRTVQGCCSDQRWASADASKRSTKNQWRKPTQTLKKYEQETRTTAFWRRLSTLRGFTKCQALFSCFLFSSLLACHATFPFVRLSLEKGAHPEKCAPFCTVLYKKLKNV